MSSARSFFSFMAGALVGAVAGLAAGVLVAPRAGAETRDMMAREANEAWDDVVDTYHKSAQGVAMHAHEAAAEMGCKTDELREKVDAARARMDQIRSNLAETAAQKAGEVVEKVEDLGERAAQKAEDVVEHVRDAADGASAASTPAAQ